MADAFICFGWFGVLDFTARENFAEPFLGWKL